MVGPQFVQIGEHVHFNGKNSGMCKWLPKNLSEARMKQRKRTTTPFAKLLSSLLEEKNIGIREAARIAGVGASTIMSWRSGAFPEDYLAVKRLAQALGTTMSFLLTGEDDIKPAGPPSIAEVFEDGGELFDGYAKITIQRLLPKTKINRKKV